MYRMVVEDGSGGMGVEICMEWHVKAVHHSSTSVRRGSRDWNRLERLSVVTSAQWYGDSGGGNSATATLLATRMHLSKMH